MKNVSVIALCALFAGACGGGEDEDPKSPPPPTSNICTVGGCSGDNICIDQACVPAFGRTYDLSVGPVSIRAADPYGYSWDSGGGAPDPLIEVYLNNDLVAATGAVQDDFSPSYIGTVPATVPAGAQITVIAWDSDVGDLSEPYDYTLIIFCEGVLTAEYLRDGGITCAGTVGEGTNGTQLDIEFQPR